MRSIFLAAIALLVTLGLSPQTTGQNDWPAYGRDPGGMKYSPLTQIAPGNVTRLARAWTYHTGEQGTQFESTPLVIGGVMYLSTQRQRIVALDAETGTELWKYDPQIRNAREHRGVAYWPGETGMAPRIVFGTGDGRLIALDAKTGTPASGFGENGAVDLRIGVADDFPRAGLAITSPPAIYKNLAITGAGTGEGPGGTNKGEGPLGDTRAWDLTTGKLVWTFHTVPRPGELGYDTWEPGSTKNRSGTNVWGHMTVDV